MSQKLMLKKILNRKMLTISFLGLSTGVPLAVVVTLVQTWITEAGIDLKTIGLFSLVQLPYTIKFLWSWVIDRYRLPFIGRRQGWMLAAQIGMIGSIALLGFFDPSRDLYPVIAMSILISFFGATHDIVIDGYRRDVLDDEELGFGSAVATNTYLIGFRFVATVFGLALAQYTNWQITFLALAGFCIIGVAGTLIAPEPKKTPAPPTNVKDAIIQPFVNYLKRSGAFEMLAFILLYKIGDNFASNLLQTFYLKIGYTKVEIATAAKLVGFWAMFAGGFIGGALLVRYSIRQCLLWFGILQAISTLGFGLLNEAVTRIGPNIFLFSGVIGFENLTSGMGTAAFAAFMLRLCDRRFSATQYALLTSFMGVPRVVIPSWAGYVAEPFGWTNFFIFSTLIAIPGLLMIQFRAKKWEEELPSS